MVCVVDDEQLPGAVTRQAVVCGTQQLGRPAGLGDGGVRQQRAECAEWDDPLRRSARHPANDGRRCGRGERVRRMASDQCLADPVGADQRHAGTLRIAEGSPDLVQEGVLRRGNPSTRHRRILWRAPLTACG